MSKRSPWRHGDLQELIARTEQLGARDVAKNLVMIREMLEGYEALLDAMETDTARLAAERNASKPPTATAQKCSK